jgi:hypothetical protein
VFQQELLEELKVLGAEKLESKAPQLEEALHHAQEKFAPQTKVHQQELQQAVD